ncbi:Thyrotroph embryonic factor [Dissostichus eleginoides]|uniref:Thyrotroph embryonic factor n=1 Tax=Dissostichus eleginoides TaxID=100907 RepID=A0AAD9B819_DISEL|nr:Thyrotroph embryonic factor [Dissostichus eleginoides]
MSTTSHNFFGDRNEVPDLLKSLAEYPFCFADFVDTEIEKEKLCSVEDVDGGGAGAASAGGGGGGGGGGRGGEGSVVVAANSVSRYPAERHTPSPVDPEAIEVDINFQPDPTDLVLSSVPGGELFNPRKHKFSEEELKPQPMIKKAKKVFVPTSRRYWSRRKKNNVAAKRSRDARRLKENQITVRASFLERENAALRQQVSELRKDCGRCKTILTRYEAKYGPL